MGKPVIAVSSPCFSQILFRSRKKFCVLWQSCFFLPTFHENFKFLKNCSDGFHKMRLAQNSFRFFFFFQKTQRVPPFTISKSFSFLSLRYGADFRRSRLVIFKTNELTDFISCCLLTCNSYQSVYWEASDRGPYFS